MNGFSEAYLESNLKALALRNPKLHHRLALDSGGNGSFLVSMAASGAPTAHLVDDRNTYLHSSIDPAGEAREAANNFLLVNQGPVLLLGLGLGYYLEAALKRVNPCVPLFAYEKDQQLLRLTLMRCDFSRDIISGRLHILSDTDIEYLGRRFAGKSGLAVWPHPVLGVHYDWETWILADQAVLGRQPEKVCDRAAVIAGGLFVEDIKEALQEMGTKVAVQALSVKNLEEDVRALSRFGPEIVFAVNYCHGLPEICETLGVPLIIWEVDPTIERLPYTPNRYPHTYIFTYRKSHVARYREAGFKHVEYLPLGTNPKRRRPITLGADQMKVYGADISFVGSSMAEQAKNLTRLYDVLTQKSSRKTEGAIPAPDYRTLWRRAIERQTQCPDRYVIAELFGHNTLITDASGRLVDLADCVGEACASQRRIHIVSNLRADGRTVKVWGDKGWRAYLPQGIQYCGEAGHYKELTYIYNGSKINLDIGRIYQRDIVTMRVFDILACKAFALVDHSDDLENLFNIGSEVVSYRSVSEIPSLVRYYLGHDAERRQIGECGYRKVLREHTIRNRIERMLKSLS